MIYTFSGNRKFVSALEFSKGRTIKLTRDETEELNKRISAWKGELAKNCKNKDEKGNACFNCQHGIGECGEY